MGPTIFCSAPSAIGLIVCIFCGGAESATTESVTLDGSVLFWAGLNLPPKAPTAAWAPNRFVGFMSAGFAAAAAAPKMVAGFACGCIVGLTGAVIFAVCVKFSGDAVVPKPNDLLSPNDNDVAGGPKDGLLADVSAENRLGLSWALLAAAIVSDRASFGFAAGDLNVEIAAPVGVNAAPFSDTGDGLGELFTIRVVAGWAIAVGLLIVADIVAGDA